MECFISAPVVWDADYAIAVRSGDTQGPHVSLLLEREGGMMISSNPNGRASTENAPGPRRTIAAARTVRIRTDSFDVDRFGLGTRTIEAHIPALNSPHRTVRAAATGVSRPARSEIPVATASELNTQAATVGLGLWAKAAVPPWMSTMTPTAALNSSRPSPLRPS